ncbi:MAG: TetR/AcrR family transcriptional regulator [Pseudomonadota bacterium]
MEALAETTPARTQAERSAATRAELIEATIELLLDQGLAHCSLAAVAKRAGLTTGAVQHQFKTKAKLMQAVIAERLFSAEPSVIVKELSALTLEDRCRSLVALQWSFYRQPEYLAIWEIILGAKTDKEIQGEITAWQRSATQAHEDAIGTVLADCNLTDSAIRSLQYFINSHLRGLAMLRTVQDDRAIVDEQIELLSRTVLSLVQDQTRQSSDNPANENRESL